MIVAKDATVVLILIVLNAISMLVKKLLGLVHVMTVGICIQQFMIVEIAMILAKPVIQKVRINV